MLKTLVFVALLAVGIYIIDDYMNGCKYQSDIRLDGKIAIVTGSNTGIGKENVIDFVLRGAKVYMACRSLEKGQRALDDVRGQTGVSEDLLVLMELDLASLVSVREFAQEFKQREKRLDILVNNAGVMWVPYSKTTDGFETTFGVNHLGHFLLTNLLVEPLVAAAPSRVVTVSSTAHKRGSIAFDDLMGEREYSRIYSYAQSKLANILFARELSRRLEGTDVTSYSLHPGAIITELTRHATVLNLPVIKQIFPIVLAPILKDAWHGARTQVFCSIEPELEKYSGSYFSDCAVKDTIPAAYDDQAARRLWEISTELVKLQHDEIHPTLRT